MRNDADSIIRGKHDITQHIGKTVEHKVGDLVANPRPIFRSGFSFEQNEKLLTSNMKQILVPVCWSC